MGWYPPALITPPAEASSSGGLVSERFSLAISYGSSAWATAWGLLNELGNTEYDIEWEVDPWVAVPTGGLDGISADRPTTPSVSPIEIDLPSFGGTPPETPDIDIDIEPAPPFNVTDPGFNIPGPPDVEFPTFTEAPPPITDPDIPLAPVVNLPPVPALTPISIPSPPEYNLPDFEGQLPTMDLTPPEPMFVWNEIEYNSDLLTQVKSKLLLDLVNGGSGLNTATEQAIYDRATARQELENQQMYDEALNFWSSRGWTEPPGALAGRLLETSYKIVRTRTDLGNDILVQQSKLAQENTHFIIENTLQNEKQLMDYTNQYQQRAYDAAKFVVESALIIYQAKVEAYKAQLETYRVQAQVFEARIRAEIAKAELYRAQIDGIRLSVDAQRLMIEAYTAQVNSILALIDIYKAQMEGAKIQSEIDRTKIQSFQALVEAYKAQVMATTEHYKAYQAQIAGEVAKAEFYTAQVNGYKARVEAYKAAADIQVARVTAEVELNKGRVEVFKALLDQYTAEVGAAVESAKAQVEIEKLDIIVFQAEVDRYRSEVDALSKLFLGRIEEARAKADVQIKQAELIIREAVAKYSLADASTQAAAKVAAQLAASALSIVSASAALGYQESRRDNRSASATMSASTADNTSIHVGHYYNHSD